MHTRHVRIVGATLALVTSAASAASLDTRWIAAGHRISVGGVAYSPDGQLAASAGDDGTAKVWRTSNGAHVATFLTPQNYGLHAVVFAPDGASLVAGGTGGAFEWRLSDGALVREYCCMETGYAVMFSPDGATLAVGGSISGLDADVVLFRRSDGAVLAELVGQHFHYVFAIAFSPDGSTLWAAEGSPFTTPQPGAIRIWDIASESSVGTLTGHTSGVRALALAPDGATLASGSLDNSIKLWDVSTRTLLDTFSGHTGAVTGLDFSPNSQSLASCSVDTSIKLWNVQTGAVTGTLSGHGGQVAAVSFSPDGSELVTAGGQVFGSTTDSSVRLWRAADGALTHTLTQFTGSLEAIAYFPNGELLAVGAGWGLGGTISLRSTIDGSEVRTLASPTWLLDLDVSPDGAWIAAGGSDRQVRIWDATTGSLLRTMSGHGNSIYQVKFSPDGQLVASAAFGEAIRLWNAHTGALVRQLTEANPGARGIAFSPDGQLLISGRDNGARIWRVSDGALLRTINHGAGSLIQAVAWSPAGDLVATGASDRAVKLWNPASGALVRTLVGHTGTPRSLAFNSDGSLLASGSENDVVLRVWRTADGAALAAIDEGTGTSPKRAAFSPDDRQIGFARMDSTVVMARSPFGPPLGDANADGEFSAADHAALAQCLFGPDVTPAPPTTTPYLCVVAFDVNNDYDVDLVDVAALQLLAVQP